MLAPDDVKIEFVGNRSQTLPIQHHHIRFNTPDVETLRAWHVEMFDAVPGVNEPFQVADLPGVNLRFSETAKMVGTHAIAFLTDPDGTYIELTEGLDAY